MALIPAFVIAAWREAEELRAYIASLAAATGLFYSACIVQFILVLTGVHPGAQRGWQGFTGRLVKMLIKFQWRLRIELGEPKIRLHPLLLA